MIDFAKLPKKNKTYSGANGNKISVVYNNELYMLKFPALASRNDAMSYANGCISEYIGCKIYKHLEIPVQDVMLGSYTFDSGKEKIVVACKDFATNGLVLQDFGSLKNQIIDSERNGYGTELNDILATIDEQTVIDSKILSDRFWDMFITDAFLGNWDRHNGNWGFLYDYATDKVTLAPVYDCGSCLYPQIDEQSMPNILADKNEMNERIYNRPTSAITQNKKRINYYSFISSCENPDCNNALRRFEKKANMSQINTIIDNTPFATDTHKTFLKSILKARKEKILDASYKKLCALSKPSITKEAFFKTIPDDTKIIAVDKTYKTNYFGS